MATIENIFRAIGSFFATIWRFIVAVFHYIGLFLGFIAKNFPFIIIVGIIIGLLWFLYKIFNAEQAQQQ